MLASRNLAAAAAQRTGGVLAAAALAQPTTARKGLVTLGASARQLSTAGQASLRLCARQARARPQDGLLLRSFHVSALQMAETVKVPQMAESISEGTLKQWNKKKGDFVNADEEVATIETDKVGARREFAHV